MCNSEKCLGLAFLIIILFFFSFILLLLKLRKSQLERDLQISGDRLWQQWNAHFSNQTFNQFEMFFSIWQDASPTTASLLIKSYKNEIVAKIEFPIGSRQYKMIIGDQIFRIVANFTWEGTNLSLISSDGVELAKLRRPPLRPLMHTVNILDYGILNSNQQLFNPRMLINYTMNERVLASTQLIALTRKIGRVGCFSNELSLPVKIFILSMTS